MKNWRFPRGTINSRPDRRSMEYGRCLGSSDDTIASEQGKNVCAESSNAPRTFERDDYRKQHGRPPLGEQGKTKKNLKSISGREVGSMLSLGGRDAPPSTGPQPVSHMNMMTPHAHTSTEKPSYSCSFIATSGGM